MVFGVVNFLFVAPRSDPTNCTQDKVKGKGQTSKDGEKADNGAGKVVEDFGGLTWVDVLDWPDSYNWLLRKAGACLSKNLGGEDGEKRSGGKNC